MRNRTHAFVAWLRHATVTLSVGRAGAVMHRRRGILGEKMIRVCLCGLSCLAITAVTGCTSLVTGGDLVRAGEATGTIAVVNETGDVLDTVLISDCGASTYGLDRLPDGVSIPPGGNYAFTVSAGCWDVDAGAMGIGEARQRMDVRVGGVTEYVVTN